MSTQKINLDWFKARIGKHVLMSYDGETWKPAKVHDVETAKELYACAKDGYEFADLPNLANPECEACSA